MILASLALMMSWSIGALVVSMLAPRPTTIWSVGLQTCAALALGLAISSGLFLVTRTALNWNDARTLCADAGLLIALGALSIVTSRSGPSSDMGRADPRGAVAPTSMIRDLRWIVCVVWVGAAVTLIFAAVTFGRLLIERPHGNWDAWAMWNMKARFFARAGDDWRLAFGDEVSGVRPDYPLLLPLTVARLWAMQGSDSTVAPRIVAAIFTSLTLLILFFAVARTADPTMAAIASTALLASAVFTDEGPSQYADMPLACFILIAIVGATAHGEAAFGLNRLRALVGLAAGAAAWTKNEGLVFAAAVFVAMALMTHRGAPLTRRAVRALMFLAGALPFLLMVIWLKSSFVWRNDLFAERSPGELVRLLTDPQRYAALWHWFITLLPDCISPWLLGALALAIGMSLAQGGTKRAKADGAGVAVGLLIAVYILIYLTTPHDQGWHMRTSFSRLVLQVWPSLLFLMFRRMTLADCRSSRLNPIAPAQVRP